MLNNPTIMGILNVTPDSFFDGGCYNEEKSWLQRAERMIAEGATIIDVGAVSTRPECNFVSEAEEKSRILPVIETIVHHFPEATISVDTFRSTVAKACIDAGVTIINDISGGLMDAKMWDTIAPHKNIKYVLMHGAKDIATMHKMIDEHADMAEIVYSFFTEKLTQLQQKHISRERVILDPGFGFGKTIAQNYQLLQKLNVFTELGVVLAGLSRKTMIWKTLHTTATAALNGTTALNMIALLNGASILRVHDVKEAVETTTLYAAYCN
jgi:dihydropteroate synthase